MIYLQYQISFSFTTEYFCIFQNYIHIWVTPFFFVRFVYFIYFKTKNNSNGSFVFFKLDVDNSNDDNNSNIDNNVGGNKDKTNNPQDIFLYLICVAYVIIRIIEKYIELFLINIINY